MKKALFDALQARGYETLTPVQNAVIAEELVGRDMLVSAQTGSGKTVGLGLAIAPAILAGDAFGPAAAPLALIIAPTRELALQVKRELAWLYQNAGGLVTSCVGGMDMRDERRALARGAHIVVATPGRLRDHIMRGSIDLSALAAVVLDEADEMLDLGFREDLEFILGEAPVERQTLMFSATVPGSIVALAKSYQRDAERVVTKSESSQHADIAYRAMLVAERDTDNAVINCLRYYDAPNAIVFANTRAMVNRLTTRLSNRGFQVVALSGELSQSERTHALQAMRDGRAKVCVATDVAARGIDLPNLDLVVHAELPSNHETLLHRSGRTGRAGRQGTSALIVTKKSHKKAERILKFAKLSAQWGSAPSADEVTARDAERMFADPGWRDAPNDKSQDLVARLVDTFTPQQLAAGYLRMFYNQLTAPEELADADDKPRPREEFGQSIWFSVTGGRAAGAEPRRLLPMLCKAGGLTKDDVGAIRVQADKSYVQILEKSVARFQAALGADMTLEEGAVVTQMSAPPKLGGGGGARPATGAPKAHRKGGTKLSKPGAQAERAEAAPIEWNDAPPPRNRKPKPADRFRKKGAGAKPANGGSSAPKRREKPDLTRDGAVSPKGKNGPPPPKGKPNSKKNKARLSASKSKMGKAKKDGTPGSKRPAR